MLAVSALAALPLARATDAPAPASAAVNPRLDEIRKQRMTQLDQTLSLTPEQKAQITAIWDKAEKQISDSGAARRMRRHRREALKEVRGVLTPE